MVRITAVAAALLLVVGPTPAQDQRPPVARVEADGLTEEMKSELADYVLRAESWLAQEEFGLKPPEPSQFSFRIRTPKRNDAIVLGPMLYTEKAAFTYYAPSTAEAMNGGGSFDPVFSVLDAAVETSWATRIRAFRQVPAAVRFGIARHLSQRLLEVMQKEGERDKNAPHWPGSATPRKGSLESLPPDHPLVQDRDRILDLLDRFDKRPIGENPPAGEKPPTGEKQPTGRAELIRILNFCNQNQLTGTKTFEAVTNLLAPLLTEEKKPLLPEVTFATREPWPGPGKNPLAARMKGVGGDARQDTVQLRLTYGEQRTTPTEFAEWSAGAAPTLLFHSPQKGDWNLKGVELCARRTVGEKDDAAGRKFWIVFLDENFHELVRWPYAQTAIPAGKAEWVNFPFNAPPELPPEFWYLALEAGDPGPGAKLEICVRPGAAGEHCFHSIPNRKVTGLAQPVDFAVIVDLTGRGMDRWTTPTMVLDTLKRWCSSK